jgi:hypothetical protein
LFIFSLVFFIHICLQAREIQKESDPERRELLLRDADQEDMYDDMLDVHSLSEMSSKRLAYVLDIEARLREPRGLHDILRQEREHRETLADLTAREKRDRSSGVSNHDAETMEWARGSMLLQEQRMEMEMDRAAKSTKIEVITDTFFASLAMQPNSRNSL